MYKVLCKQNKFALSMLLILSEYVKMDIWGQNSDFLIGNNMYKVLCKQNKFALSMLLTFNLIM